MDTSLNLKQKVSPITVVFLAVVFLGAILFFLGQYHIVFGTKEILVKRPYVGFSDIIGDVNACTGIPKIIAMSNHPSLCQALTNAGYLSR